MKLTIPPQHPALKAYYEVRQALSAQHATHELAVRTAFQNLLDGPRPKGWTLVMEQKVEGLKRVVRPDATLRDSNTLPRGYWEAKDTQDDLEAEITRKLARGYPKSNIIFEDSQRAVLYQSGQRVGEYSLERAEELATLLTRFYGFTEIAITDFEQAVAHFQAHTPELAEGLKRLIAEAHATNKRFQSAYASFFELCRSSLNPNISQAAAGRSPCPL